MSRLNKMLGVDDETIEQLRIALSLGKSARRVCETIGYLLKHKTAHPERLFTVVFAAEPGDYVLHDVHQLVSETRMVLRKFGIRLHLLWEGEGWLISPADKEKLRSMMNNVPSEVVAANLERKASMGAPLYA